MKFKKQHLLILLSLFIVSTQLYLNGQENNKARIKDSDTKQKADNKNTEKKYNEPDKENLDFINYFFSNFPKYAIKMKATENETKQVLEKLQNMNAKEKPDDEKLLKDCIEQLLKGSEQFFAPLHSFRNWTITSSTNLISLAEIVLLQNIEHLKLEELNITNDKNYSPLLLQFFKQDDAKGFFKKTITGKTPCLQVCYEFLTIIGVLWQSLTKDTLKSAQDWYKKNILKNKTS